MKKLFKRLLIGIVNIMMTFSIMAMPLIAVTYAAQQPIVTTQSYDMDEYLNMLVSTGQWEKYNKFLKIADGDSIQKHLAWYQNQSLSDTVYFRTEPLSLVKAEASTYGFDAKIDTFDLFAQSNDKAWIRVLHNEQLFYVVAERASDGYWYVAKVYTAK